MTVDDAFLLFRAAAASAGFPEVDERVHPEHFGSRVSTLNQDSTGLRLVWDGKEQFLRLEVTHGPGDSVQWLDLYQASQSRNRLHADQDDFTFADAVEHGLDLLASSSRD
ncbi:MAG: hypothetical protein AAF845_11115 [Bacteroidota bacterium]